ncbi:MAG: DUF1501 domain-containing protein [Acidobacteria bacterium]|nr:DUF1501 domain-containing protein [Acidobacteriota bacterium]MCW5970247.1 DUF1501 domain-containing protein [Blastocatellales bacterium]
MVTRRFLLKSGSAALAGLGAAVNTPSFLGRVAAAGGANRRRVLVAIFQRGAMDGLNAVAPYGERAYYDLRPNLAIPRPGAAGAANGSAIDLDGFFGLHPSLAPFKPLYDEKRLAIVHAVGSPDGTRSHFDAQDYMESGTPGVKSTPDGWLNRYMQSKPDSKASPSSPASPFRAVSMGANLPRALQGRAPAVAMTRINDFGIRGGMSGGAVEGGFESIYAETVDKALGAPGRETFEAVKLLKRVNPSQYQPADGVNYPRGRFGESLRQTAQLIKADVGLEVAFTDIGGWDTHVNQGGVQGQLALRLTELAQGIAALYADLREYSDEVLILTMTEFGRTARENGNRGTDHGHASAMFVLGGAVKGGRVYGRWPGLKPEQLNENRDLALTTDFRDLFAEIAKQHLGAGDLNAIFPGYEVKPANFVGLL